MSSVPLMGIESRGAGQGAWSRGFCGWLSPRQKAALWLCCRTSRGRTGSAVLLRTSMSSREATTSSTERGSNWPASFLAFTRTLLGVGPASLTEWCHRRL